MTDGRENQHSNSCNKQGQFRVGERERGRKRKTQRKKEQKRESWQSKRGRETDRQKERQKNKQISIPTDRGEPLIEKNNRNVEKFELPKIDRKTR